MTKREVAAWWVIEQYGNSIAIRGPYGETWVLASSLHEDRAIWDEHAHAMVEALNQSRKD